MNEEEKIIMDLLSKGNKQVVEWITKLNANELYELLTRNITYKTIMELLELFNKDSEQYGNHDNY